MRRVLLGCGGILLGTAAGVILWYAPEQYAFADAWHSPAFTRLVGLGIIVEGALAAFGAALCLGRAVVPLAAPRMGSSSAVAGSAAVPGGGPILPLCGIVFLLAAIGPFGQAHHDAGTLEVMDNMPGQWGSELVADLRTREKTEWSFAVLWLVTGGALLATPLFLKPSIWQMGWPLSGAGVVIALGGFLLSGMGLMVCSANGLMGEGARKELSWAGQLGILAGAIIALVGSVGAAAGRLKTKETDVASR